jgi:hypothetical protein
LNSQLIELVQTMHEEIFTFTLVVKQVKPKPRAASPKPVAQHLHLRPNTTYYRDTKGQEAKAMIV